MRTVSKLIAGATALAAVAGVAYAADRNAHVLAVVLPDGSVEHVRYVGDVPPQIALAPADGLHLAALPAGDAPAFAGMDASFAMLDRMMADMAAGSDAMLRQAALLASGAMPAAGAMPDGTVSYSVTSFTDGNGAPCTQSVRMTALGQGQAPKIDRRQSGDCRPMNTSRATPAAQAAPAAPARPEQPAIVPVRYETGAPPPAGNKPI